MGAPRRDLVGRSLGTRYDVLELLGSGGMGAVYRALDRELDEVVALKVIRAELANDAQIVEHFRREVRLARRVTHKNVARTFELGRIDDVLFCTMELVDGESLAKRLARQGRVPLGEAVAIACELCDGLAAAHEAGVIHRDVKPDNVLIDVRERVVLTDFGVASVIVEARGAAVGTPAYMAPEQARGEPTMPVADVYAVGVLLFEMITGTRAFEGTPFQIYEAKQAREALAIGDVPVALADAIAGATARDPGQRCRSAGELRAQIAPFAGVLAPARARRAMPPPARMMIVVRPPRGGDDKLYLAHAVHAELLLRLARVPRLGVKTAGDAPIAIDLVAGDGLDVTVTGPGGSLRLGVALHVTHVAGAAEAIVAAIGEMLTRPLPSVEGYDLFWQANASAYGVTRWGQSTELLERAAALAPNDARISATLALAKLQRAFFANASDRSALDEAAELARFAIRANPDLYEAQLAAGMLELHLGDSALASGHFRVAIACAPFAPVAHEQLGRMLLEAGHLDEGLARLREAIALSPHQVSARWEIARANALEGDWSEHDGLVAELRAHGQNVVLGELRFVLWRGDLEHARRLRALMTNETIWDRWLFEAMIAVLCDHAWEAHRAQLLELAAGQIYASPRRRAAVAQFVTESACVAGDLEAADQALAHAVEHGLFDRHWLARCYLLDPLRDRAAFARTREQVETRATAIRDALYGDYETATRVDGSPDGV